MATIRSVSTILSYFFPGAFPTDVQLQDSFYSFRHKSETIDQDQVKKAAPYSGNVGASVTILADSLISVVVLKPTASGVIFIGTTPGGTEVLQAIDVVSGTNLVIEINQYFEDATTLHIGSSGGGAGSVKIYTQ